MSATEEQARRGLCSTHKKKLKQDLRARTGRREGVVATIRANGAHFGGRSSVVAVALVILASALGVLTVLAGTAQPSRADDTGLTCFGRQATVTGIIGTNGDDVIIGSQTTNDTIVGLGGNDRICGLGGDDLLSGGPDDDHVDGGPGNDRVGGDSGFADTNPDFAIDGGNDEIFGGPGNDGMTADHFLFATGEISGDGGMTKSSGARGSTLFSETTGAPP